MFHSLFICEQATGNSTDTTTGTSIRPTSGGIGCYSALGTVIVCMEIRNIFEKLG